MESSTNVYLTNTSTSPDIVLNTTRDMLPIYIYEGPILDTVNSIIFIQTLLPSFVYVCILLLLGIPGNVLVIYVYLLKWNKSTSRIFILALGIYDLINCLVSMTTEVALLLHFIKFDFPVFCKVSRFITGCITAGSTFLLVVIAVDRFKRICRISDNQIVTSLAKRITFLSVVFAVVTSWPMLILYGTQTINFPLTGTVIVGKTCLIDNYYNTTVYPLAFVLLLLVVHFIVDIVLIVLYVLIGRVVFRQHAARKSMKMKVPSSSSCRTEISEASVTMEDLDDNPTKKKDKTPRRPVSFLQFRHSMRSKTNAERKTNKLLMELKKSISNKISQSSVQSMDTRKIHAGKTTFMLFLVTIGFIVSFLPYSILVLIRYEDTHFFGRLSSAGKSVYQLFLRSYLLNSVLNPIVYCFVSKQFRLKCKEGIKGIFGQ